MAPRYLLIEIVPCRQHAHTLISVGGVGLRAAQDIGAHRESSYASGRAFENQMCKRVFWYGISLGAVEALAHMKFHQVTRSYGESPQLRYVLDFEVKVLANDATFRFGEGDVSLRRRVSSLFTPRF